MQLPIVPPDFITSVASIVGPTHVLTGAPDTASYYTDWRGNYRGEALAVVKPSSVEQVSRVVALCAEHRVGIVPQAGNTGLVGGAVPMGDAPQIVLSVTRLNQQRGVDVANRTLTVEAGVTLKAVQDYAQASDLLYPVSLAAEGTAEIGGTIATNAGGVQVLRYGNTRDQVLGLEAVLPDGRIWHGLSGLRKDNTGYDLKHLLVGSEGTLGIVTAACLKLAARPKQSVVAWAALPNLTAAVALLGRLQSAASDRITAFEVVSDVCMQLLARHLALSHPLSQPTAWNALIEFADTDADYPLTALAEKHLSAAIEAEHVVDVVIAQSETQANGLWNLREHTPEAEKLQGRAAKHDISLPVSAIPQFVHETDALLAEAFPGALVVNFGHLGDGNLHYNLTGVNRDCADAIYAQSARANAIVYDQVAKFGGSISAEHGLGQLKRESIKRYKSAVALDMMRAIKSALDPLGIMNPGKLL